MQLSGIWSDGMVLQRNQPILLSGRAGGNQVTAVFAGRYYQAKTEPDGSFCLRMEPQEAGGPYELELYDAAKTTIRNIWVGDVWVLGGQSNMELPVQRTMDVVAPEIEAGICTEVHQFQVPQEFDFHGPRREYRGGSWKRADSQTVMDFSTVGYFFGKRLAETLQVPIGLIKTSLGGTPVEAWMSESSLKELGICQEQLARNREDAYVNRVMAADAARIRCWYDKLEQEDAGLHAETPWYALSYEQAMAEDRWDGALTVPGMWESTPLADAKGSVWFCTRVEIPQSWCTERGIAEQELLLRVGTIIDADDVYVNGVLTGHTDYRYPPRKYKVAPGLFHAGSNTIWVRVIIDGNPGGFMPDKLFCVERTDTKERVYFDGVWKYRIGASLNRLAPQTFFQYEPSGVFHGMLSPLHGLSVKGVIFYQGESNDSNPADYGKKFAKMIADWREVLADPQLPFLYVQLAGFGDGRKEDTGTAWARLRAEQASCQGLPGVGMVSAIDLGEYNDLHPQRKSVLGRRLAEAARAIAYGENAHWKSPEAVSAGWSEEALQLTVRCRQQTGELQGSGMLQLFYTDGSSCYAAAQTDHCDIVCRTEAGKKPTEVRYGWENFPRGLGFTDEKGLPLLPFRMPV